jgi:hypothetical protein
MCFGEVGLDLDGAAEVSQGAVEIAAQTQRVAEVVAGQTEVRLDLERLAELEDGLVRLALRQKDQSQVVGRFGRARLKTQGRAKALGGTLEVAQRTVRLAQVGVIGGIPEVQGDGPPDTFGSLMVISLLVESDAQQVQGVGVVGLGAEDAAVAPDGLDQQSALVFLEAEGKLVVHGDALSNLNGGSMAKFLAENRIICITITEE